MYVRLAFAVAAFLEPEILVVDEVLAVGDAEFQKKCLGRMKDVSVNEGRTVLFVSHNMAAIQNLCSRSVLLSSGELEIKGDTGEVVSKYLATPWVEPSPLGEIEKRGGDGSFRFESLSINGIPANTTVEVEAWCPVVFEFQVRNFTNEKQRDVRIDVGVNDGMGQRVAWMSTAMVNSTIPSEAERIRLVVENLPLVPGRYDLNLYAESDGRVVDHLRNVAPFYIAEADYFNTGRSVPGNQGVVLLKFDVEAYVQNQK